MLRTVAASIICSLAMCLAGCSLLSHEAPPEDIDKAATLFFRRLDKGEYDTIYDDAAKKFKANKSRATVTDNLKQLTAFGKTLGFERVSMQMQGEGKDRILLPAYKVQFEQGRAEVTLMFQDESGEWKLFGFSLKPKQ